MTKHLNEAAKRFIEEHFVDKKNIRLHTTNKKMSLNDIYDVSQDKPLNTYQKPTGIWYGINDSWLDWCIQEDFNGIGNYIYQILIEEDKVLKIDNISKFEKFEAEYGIQANNILGHRFAHRLMLAIDFEKISTQYGGIEIAPYLWEKRLESVWYYGWDCASGCVWNRNVITKMRILASYNPKHKKFTLQSNKNTV